MNDDNKVNEDFRRLLATATKLESIQSNLESVIDFFLAPTSRLYAKLCNDSLKLLFGREFKLDYFRKAEELVWRRIYHDLYRFQRSRKVLVNNSKKQQQDAYLMESHFISGIGFYSSLIIKLRSHYKINESRGIISPLDLSFGPIDNFACERRLNFEDDINDKDDDFQSENHTNTTNHDHTSMFVDIDNNNDKYTYHPISGVAQEWARQAIYRSLVYMGDLARYLLETSQSNFRDLAFKFYLSASRNQPDYGLPFNQLATLAGGVNHNLDAVCNYMRCSLRSKSFDGAEGNMKKIFDLNNSFFEEIQSSDHIINSSEVLSSKDPASAAESLVRATIVIFIRMISNIRAAICDQNDDDNDRLETIIHETRLFFQTLREALELEPIVPMDSSGSSEQDEFSPISRGSNSVNRLRYISPTVVYEFCSISLMLIAECQKRKANRVTKLDPIQDNLMDLVNTLALNLLHYATAKCYKMIIAKVQELRIRGCGSNACNESLMRSSYSNNSLRSSENVNSLSDSTSKRTKSRIRQKKAVANFSDDKNNMEYLVHNSDDDSELSELEETALSTIDALDISSGMSEEGDYQADLIDLSSASDEEMSTIESRRKVVGSTISLRADSGLSKPALRQTRSQNYEMLRATNNSNSYTSLLVPDLVTEDNLNYDATLDNPSRVSSDDNGSNRIDSFKLNETCDFESVMSHLYTQTYLPTVKILCDWLLANSALINSNVPSFREFRDELGEMVASLNDLKKLTRGDCCCQTSIRDSFEERANESPIFKHAFDGPNWTQRYPLSCDHPLYCLGSLRSVHEKNIDFSYEDELTTSESGFITVQCVIAFSHALTAFLDLSSLANAHAV